MCLHLAITPFVFSQNKALNGKIADFLKYRPQEKAFLHLNKHVFAAGEGIWFKVYLTDAVSLRPSDLSKVLYVDLTDAENKLIDSRTLKVKDGMCHGDFTLNDSISSGDYYLKVYTNYMLNFDPELLPTTPIRILNNNKPSLPKKSAESASTDVQFFPESGQMVAGLVNNIGFKAIDSSGLGTAVSGQIFDSQDNLVTSFQSEHAGMGNFKLIPKEGEHYLARIYEHETALEFMLPEVSASGAIIQIKPDTGSIELKVLAHDYSLENHLLLGYQNGMNVLELKPTAANNMYSVFSTQNLPSGIIYFTLFDGDNRPVAERLAFVNNSKKLPKLDISCKEKIGNREKLEINLNYEKDVPAELSMSVVNFHAAGSESDNILTYLLLTSDLKGNIEAPQFYFEDYDSRKVRLLDQLMMTQGWRRFTWKEVLADSLPTIHQYLEQSMSIRGQLFGYENQKKAQSGEVSLTVMENPMMNGSVSTGEDGKFEFSGLDFEDTVSIILQANKLGKKKVKKNKANLNDPYTIKVTERQRPILPDITPLHQLTISDEEEYNAFMEKIHRIERMYGEEVVILDALEIKRARPTEISPETKFLPAPSYRVILDSLLIDPRNMSPTVQDMLQIIRMPGFNPSTLTSRGVSTISGGKTIKVYYMGQLFGVESIASGPPPGWINPQNIGAIDYFTGLKSSQFGVEGGQGVLVLYPRKQSELYHAVFGIKNFKFPGYYQAREFYSPNYEVEKSEVPDYRSTLYWNPNIWLSKGKAQVSFYTSDEDNIYVIDVQGITSNGDPIARNYIFTVE